jgi:hypothetical protein
VKNEKTVAGDAGDQPGDGAVDEAGRGGYTWGQIMVALKQSAQTGRHNPVSHSTDGG